MDEVPKHDGVSRPYCKTTHDLLTASASYFSVALHSFLMQVERPTTKTVRCMTFSKLRSLILPCAKKRASKTITTKRCGRPRVASLQRILLLASEVQIAPEGEHLQLGMWRNVISISCWGALVQAIVAISMWAFAYDFIL